MGPHKPELHLVWKPRRHWRGGLAAPVITVPPVTCRLSVRPCLYEVSLGQSRCFPRRQLPGWAGVSPPPFLEPTRRPAQTWAFPRRHWGWVWGGRASPGMLSSARGTPRGQGARPRPRSGHRTPGGSKPQTLCWRLQEASAALTPPGQGPRVWFSGLNPLRRRRQGRPAWVPGRTLGRAQDKAISQPWCRHGEGSAYPGNKWGVTLGPARRSLRETHSLLCRVHVGPGRPRQGRPRPPRVSCVPQLCRLSVCSCVKWGAVRLPPPGRWEGDPGTRDLGGWHTARPTADPKVNGGEPQEPPAVQTRGSTLSLGARGAGRASTTVPEERPPAQDALDTGPRPGRPQIRPHTPAAALHQPTSGEGAETHLYPSSVVVPLGGTLCVCPHTHRHGPTDTPAPPGCRQGPTPPCCPAHGIPHSLSP